MTQLDMFTAPPPERARGKRRRVRETSRAQYQIAEGFGGRKGDVLRWLSRYYEYCLEWPTSAELAQFCGQLIDLNANVKPWDWKNWTDMLLYIRHGLSDLQPGGDVERVPKGDRACGISGRKCCTWRVTPRK